MSEFFSIIVPVYNESESINFVVEEIFSTMKLCKNNFELIVVNDGSTDKTIDKIELLKKKYKIRLINNNINKGQSFSIFEAIKYSNYKTVITLDGDGQNDPNDIKKLLNIYNTNQYGLVGGIRKKRKDSYIKIISSKIANKIRSFILNDNCEDTGCSLKIFNKEVFLKFPYFDGMHRYLPALFGGFKSNTVFIEVNHRARFSGNSKYGIVGRLFKGIKDLVMVYFLLRKLK